MSRRGITYEVVVEAIKAVLKEGRDVSCRNVQAELRKNPANGSPSNSTIIAHIHRYEVDQETAVEHALTTLSSGLQRNLLTELVNRDQILRQSLDGQLDAARKALGDALAELSNATGQVTRLTEDLDAVKEAATLQAESLRQKLAHATGQVEALEKRCKDLSADASEARDEAARLRHVAQHAEQAAAKAEARLATLVEQVESLRVELAAAQRDAAVSAERATGMEGARAALETQVSGAHERVARLEKENQALFTRLQELAQAKATAEQRAAVAEVVADRKGKPVAETATPAKTTRSKGNGSETVSAAAET